MFEIIALWLYICGAILSFFVLEEEFENFYKTLAAAAIWPILLTWDIVFGFFLWPLWDWFKK